MVSGFNFFRGVCLPAFEGRAKRAGITNIRLLAKNKGQALIEFLVLSLSFVSIIQILFGIAWIFINLIWMEHHLYQSVLCVAQERKKVFCERRFLKDIKKLNPKAEIKSLNFNSKKGEFKWRFYKQDFVIQQSFELPF